MTTATISKQKSEAFCPGGVCVVCGSGLIIQFWRGHPGNQRIHCNDCGTEVTPLMHAKKQKAK